jgi:hypothetical protein
VVNALKIVQALELVVPAVRRRRPVGDFFARLSVAVENEPVAAEATVTLRNRKTQVVTSGHDTRVTNLVSMSQNFAH